MLAITAGCAVQGQVDGGSWGVHNSNRTILVRYQLAAMTLVELQKIRQDRADRLDLASEFYCRPRRRKLTIEHCLRDYLNANAFFSI